jgi:hypothetical protein
MPAIIVSVLPPVVNVGDWLKQTITVVIPDLVSER